MDLIVIRGGGDLATGVVQKFYRSGFNILILETEKPTAIRRKVSLCEAIYEGEFIVEDICCKRIYNVNELDKTKDFVPIIVDRNGDLIQQLQPIAVIDAIIAKKNIGTNKSMAPITIALGPGFEAGLDVDIVIETMRGHNLGRLIFEGCAIPNTNVPAEINGVSNERVIYAQHNGIIKNIKNIGDFIEKNEIIAEIDSNFVTSPITGIIRGLIRDNFNVKKGLKIADIDPRVEEKNNYFTISDKARTLGGSALEGFLYLYNKK